MPRIRLEPGNRLIECGVGEKLSEIIRKAGIDLETICGERKKCGRCKIIIRSNAPSVKGEEKCHLSSDEIKMGFRLACCVAVTEDMEIFIPKESIREEQVILEKAEIAVKLDPEVRTFEISLPHPSLENQIGNFENIVSKLINFGEIEYYASIPVLDKAGHVLRKKSEISVTIRRNEVIDVQDESHDVVGAAVDIGTTTIVCYLIDLKKGKCLSMRSCLNPQIRHGEDVLSRMTFSLKEKNGLAILHLLVVKAVGELIDQCCKEASVDMKHVYEVVVVGNTAMHHMFYGLDTFSLGRSPFTPLITRSFETKAREIGLEISPEGYVYSLPNIAAFVGSDHVADILYTRLWECDKPTMVIDIGTNGEISIGNKDGIVCTSCAAGPALEGGGVKFGMRGANGAIDHICITDDLEFFFTTIGKSKAKGICGSGIVDLIAELFRAGLIDSKGKINISHDHPRIQVIGGEPRVVIADSDESAIGTPIFVTQKDIREILNAKAALFVGASTLMSELGVSRVDKIYLAGAFGNYIRPSSAVIMGMIPDIPLDQIIPIGNAAGAGAKIALVNRNSRTEAKELIDKVRYIELAARHDFQERYYEALFIPHLNMKLFPTVESIFTKRSAT